MRYFVTGASGFVGSATVPHLLAADHEVVGLARSDASAAALAAAGVEVVRGDLGDLDVLRAAADGSDGVLHLGFAHDFTRFVESMAQDRAVVDAFGEVLAGSDRPLVIASGTIGLPTDRVVTERDEPTATGGPRAETARATVALAERGVRSVVVRLAPSVHGRGDHGFVPVLVDVARERGVSGYPGDGGNHWPGVHVDDAGRLFRLALDQAPAGSVLHGVGEEGVRIRAIAEVIGRHLDVPVEPVADPDAHFAWLGRFLALDVRASHAITTELVGWEPTGPGLLEDLDEGHYFDLSTRMGGGSTA